MIIPVKVNGKDRSFSINNRLAAQLDKIKQLINGKDRDYVIIIDGEEGCGKSSFASQLAYYIDPTFTEDRMCLNPEIFGEKINSAQKGQAVVFDEAYTGLGSRSSLSTVNKTLVELMMEMRKKNLFVILCIPSIFYLERYPALHRARALFHCYFKNGKPGQTQVYNQRNLRKLYIYGKVKMSYFFPNPPWRLRFSRIAPIDWERYEQMKIKSLKSKTAGSKTLQKQMFRLQVALKIMKSKGMTNQAISDSFARYNCDLTPDYIRRATTDKDGFE